MNFEDILDIDLDKVDMVLREKFPEQTALGDKMFLDQMNSAGFDPIKLDIEHTLFEAEQKTEDLIVIASMIIDRFKKSKVKNIADFSAICSIYKLLKRRGVTDSLISDFFIEYPHTMRTIFSLIPDHSKREKI